MIDVIPGWAATLLAALCGALVVLHVNRSNARRAACTAFRNAVLSEIGGFYPDSENCPVDIRGHLRKAFPALQTAVVAFRPFICKRKLKGFDLAWQRFYGAADAQNEAHLYHQYMGYSGIGETEAQADEKSKNAFHTNVTNLLLFSDET